MKTWLLTSTFYGNWLPGDVRGFVGRVRERREGESASQTRQEHDAFGTGYDQGMPGLNRHARSIMKGNPILLTKDQADQLIDQFLETAAYRHWNLLTVAIMKNHVHLVVELPDDVHGNIGLQSFKSYGSRRLNRIWGEPSSGTWWTSKGSARLKVDPTAIRNAIRYVENQDNALLIWSRAAGAGAAGAGAADVSLPSVTNEAGSTASEESPSESPEEGSNPSEENLSAD